jgi:hypothetical protein
MGERPYIDVAAQTDAPDQKGWYLDAEDPAVVRYWNGKEWSTATRPGPGAPTSQETNGESSVAEVTDSSGGRVVYVEKAGNGLAVAGFVCAIIGAFAGLIPILFWIALPLGVLGLVFGIIGRRRAKANPSVGRKGMSTWAICLGVVAIGLGIVGIAIVNDAFNDLDNDLSCIDKADTPAEIDACN